MMGAAVVLAVLFAYRPATTWPGLLIVAAGIPVYWWLRRRNAAGLPAANTDGYK